MPEASIKLLSAERTGGSDDQQELALFTDRGAIPCRYHPADAEGAAILWVFGAGGGLGGPAGGVYNRLGRQLRTGGIASLEVAYRRPAQLTECIIDVLVAAMWLESTGHGRIVLVGHSFGGAVVLNAAAHLDSVVAVAALSSQAAGVGDVAALAPRPLLFVHGEEDEVLPARCSRELFGMAREPKRLILYPQCLHGLDDCRDRLDADLTSWIAEVLTA